jgi:hypothetical protein
VKEEIPRAIEEVKGKWCPGWESNPHEEKSPEDFKSLFDRPEVWETVKTPGIMRLPVIPFYSNL